MLGEDVVQEPDDDRTVEVIAAEVRVAVGREHLEHAVLHTQDRDVEGPAAEVVHGDDTLFESMEPIGERRRGRLVDDAHDIEAGDPSGVLRRLALAVVEIRRDRDDGLLDRLPEVSLGALLERSQHDRRHLGRRYLAAPDLDLHDPIARSNLEGEVAELLLDVLVPSPHEPLDGVDGRGRPPHEQPLRRLADHHALSRERHHRRQEHTPLLVGDHPRETRLLVDVRDETVGGPEINADDA